MKVRKKCSTCRHYESSPIRGQGWCRNPLLRKPHERSLVGAGELVCDKKFYDFWEPVPSRRGEAPPRPAAGQDASAPVRGVAGGPRAQPAPTASWLPDLSAYLSYVYAVGAAVALVAVVVLTGLLTGPVESGLPPSPTATIVPTVTPAVTIPSLAAVATPTSTPPSTATPSATPPPAVVVVANTGGDGVYIRRTPVMGDRIIAWVEGTELQVVGPDVDSEGQPWKHVKDPKGNVGYVPAKYTKPK